MRAYALLLLFLAVPACDKKDASSSDASAPLTVTSATPAASSAFHDEVGPDASAGQHTFLGYQGKIGESGDFRIALDRSGDKLEGIYTRGGEDVGVRGDVKGIHFTLTEVVAKGQKAATFEGTLDGQRITGTWKEPKAKAPVPFSAGPLDAFGARAQGFEQSYLGSLGQKTRIRAKLKKDKGTLAGIYRYTRSKEDLHLDGTINEANGSFELKESNAKGVQTGVMRGVFLERGTVLGRWSSPDGARSFPITLSAGNAFPEPVSLPGGGKIAPQEDYKDKGKFCTTSIFFPEVSGTPNKAAEKTLNQALRAEAGNDQITCEGASEELRYETEVTYDIDAVRPRLFAIEYELYSYAGGAHGSRALECYAADVDKGSLTKLVGKLVAPEPRKKLEALTNAALKKEAGVTKLTDALFFADEVTIADETTLCVSGSDLVVQFQSYEVGPYALGYPSAKIAKADAAPLVAGTPLEPFFK
jgi:hypothetical protein